MIKSWKKEKNAVIAIDFAFWAVDAMRKLYVLL